MVDGEHTPGLTRGWRVTAPIDRILADPWGPLDDEAEALRLHLRVGPIAGKLVLIAERDGSLALARLPETRPGRIERLGPVYADVLKGERDILRCRYEAMS